MLAVLVVTAAVQALVPPPPVVAQRKSDLKTSLADLRRQPSKPTRDSLLCAIADLEACNTIDASPAGRWALIFSTQASEPDPRQQGRSPVQPLIDATYALFFKVAPALAGAQQDGGAGGGGSNEQSVDLSQGVVENRVRVPLPDGVFGGGAVEIFVDGEVSASSADKALLDVAFTECSFRWAPKGGSGGAGDRRGSLRVPLPRPVGTLRTTFCDEELRVSRGGRGGVFVLRRLRDRP